MKIKFLVLLTVLSFGCTNSDSETPMEQLDYKQEMRDFVIGISQKAKSLNPAFAVIPQNGIELVTQSGNPDGVAAQAYLQAIDGNGQEDLFYGYDNDNVATPAAVTDYLKSFLDISKANGKTILVTDYCSSTEKIADAHNKNSQNQYISYAATERALNVIPSTAIPNENGNVIGALSQAKNFLFLINPENFTSKQEFINAVAATNYDAVILDLFFNNTEFTADDVAQLKNKANGGKRMVICYMSIGEAEDYRYYWNDAWNNQKPDWIKAENPDWPGNYKVKYWNGEWQAVIFRNQDSYLNKIVGRGFDGVYLDIIDAFEYFEN
ncbi:MAG: hypothetical protein CFE23_15560 [Flavobacterium sp. BFFFF1]|uniref:endo alpha-1,4 polygalactosaminidase n=1 Tax=Flavobacterium sp. BFFFF1 TaxID=2015557 RepID=UPI000BCACEE5|nr:endo alpha-1,4 polygalactosaminidase [Flavobacterium sp. BFFFF1]OYU79120.1 MAG: hypothetical protein CFE23_15560 [Flavobacterium sp. BFFFF1]